MTPTTPATRLEIIVPGAPIAEARHRTRVVESKYIGGKPHTQNYTPAEVLAWRAEVLRAARATPGYPSEPWTGPIRLTLQAYFDRTQEMLRPKAPAGPIRKNTKPDCDNVVKLVMDALTPPRLKRTTGNAVIDEQLRKEIKAGYLWKDDGQVHLGPVDRYYAAKGSRAGVIIIAEQISAGTEAGCLY